VNLSGRGVWGFDRSLFSQQNGRSRSQAINENIKLLCNFL